MAYGGNDDSEYDGLKSTQVGVSNVSADQGRDVDPEAVEGSQAGSCLLAFAKSTRLGQVVGGTSTVNWIAWALLLNEVLEDLDRSVVGESLCKLAECDGPGGPWDRLWNTAQSLLLFFGRQYITVLVLGLLYVLSVLDVAQRVELVLCI